MPESLSGVRSARIELGERDGWVGQGRSVKWTFVESATRQTGLDEHERAVLVENLMKYLSAIVLAALCFAPAAFSEPKPQIELKPQLADLGKLLLDENFSGAALPANWQPGGRPNSFSVVDGALRGVAQPDDAHGPAIGVPIDGHNLTVAFRMKFAQPGYFLFLIDGDSQFGGQAHLLRFALAFGQEQLAQDRGTPASHLAQGAARAAAQKEGAKLPTPSPEQLADPTYYRTESLAKQTAKTTDGEWHQVLIEVVGNEVLAQMDDLPLLRGKGTVLDAKKSRIVFLVGSSGTVLVSQVRVWENQPKP
jgi:hypothetical protein